MAYNYIRGPNTLGIGTENFGLIRPQPPLTADAFGAYPVKGSIGPTAPAFLKLTKDLPAQDIRGYALYRTGAFELQALTQYRGSIR